jgi:hypothetical protein
VPSRQFSGDGRRRRHAAVVPLQTVDQEVDMTKNMGAVDRVIRAIIAVAIAALWITGTISGGLALILGVVAVVFAATSASGYCPAYKPFGFSSRKGTA